MDSSPGNHGNIASLSVVGWHAPKWLLMTWIVCCSQGSEIRASTMWVQQKCKWTQLIILYVLYYVTSFHKLCEFFEIFCVFARHYYSMADQQNSSKMLTTHFPWHCWASKVLFSWFVEGVAQAILSGWRCRKTNKTKGFALIGTMQEHNCVSQQWRSWRKSKTILNHLACLCKAIYGKRDNQWLEYVGYPWKGSPIAHVALW